ncbi:MAG: GNAT family N-acetyltransferase [Chloroflexi bacterium]|nr:GNAT family N-acetyltransferase [Chloroflexota bacterium]
MAEPRWLALGQQTRIREFTRRDVDRWCAWSHHEDPLFSSYNPTEMTGPMRDAWYDDLVHRQQQLPYAIEDLERRLVGRLFLRHIREREGTAVLGIDLDPTMLGRGLGTDALRAFLTYYFGPARFTKMYLSVAAFNVRARRSYDRCGFQEFATHWQVLKSDADVLGDPRYAEVRHLFRRSPEGVEALMQDMVARSPLRQWSGPVRAARDPRPRRRR